MSAMPAILKIYFELLLNLLTRNLVGSIRVTGRKLQLEIQDGSHGSHLENLF